MNKIENYLDIKFGLEQYLNILESVKSEPLQPLTIKTMQLGLESICDQYEIPFDGTVSVESVTEKIKAIGQKVWEWIKKWLQKIGLMRKDVEAKVEEVKSKTKTTKDKWESNKTADKFKISLTANQFAKFGESFKSGKLLSDKDDVFIESEPVILKGSAILGNVLKDLKQLIKSTPHIPKEHMGKGITEPLRQLETTIRDEFLPLVSSDTISIFGGHVIQKTKKGFKVTSPEGVKGESVEVELDKSTARNIFNNVSEFVKAFETVKKNVSDNDLQISDDELFKLLDHLDEDTEALMSGLIVFCITSVTFYNKLFAALSHDIFELVSIIAKMEDLHFE